MGALLEPSAHLYLTKVVKEVESDQQSNQTMNSGCDINEKPNQVSIKKCSSSDFVSMGLLAALPLSAIMPGTFVLDTAVSTFVVFHLYHGMYGMIADYIPLIMPEAVVGPLQQLFGLFCVLVAALWIHFNYQSSGFGAMLNATLRM